MNEPKPGRDKEKVKKSAGLAPKQGHSGVLVGMHIYLITNKINGKQYVGKTVRKNPQRRWSEHKKDGRKKSMNVISRAIRKYGDVNFTFEVIETVGDPILLVERESFYINQYDTMTPKGYNVVLHQPHFVLSPEARVRKSINNQGKPKSKTKTSKYLGVYRKGKSWGMEIQKGGISYPAQYPTEIEAARVYDMMALYLYGDTARINFLITEYSQDEINRTFEDVTSSTKTSLYRGVDYVTSRNTWRAVVHFAGVGSKTWVYLSSSEREAAEAYDRASIYIRKAIPDKLNFPSRYDEYIKEDLAAFCYRAPRSSQYPGVSYRSENRTYRARLRWGDKYIYCGDFKTEEEAKIALDARRLLLQSTK